MNIWKYSGSSTGILQWGATPSGKVEKTDVLSHDQKKDKIKNILQKMRLEILSYLFFCYLKTYG
jgi:hypothetical protein